MTACILDGAAIAKEIRKDLKQQIEQMRSKSSTLPSLAVVLVGENAASQLYVKNKSKACTEIGLDSKIYSLPATIQQFELIELINQLNTDPLIAGILIQLPLPSNFNPDEVTEQISPIKDVDGFHPYNIGRLVLKRPVLRSCTPKGIMTLLTHARIDLAGLDAVVIGQSNIVGRPMALELLAARCTVTICHSRTQNLAAKVRSADLVVAAVGHARFVPGDWIKENAILIDVGINREPDGKLVGDLDFAACAERAAWITPVPGGVGPMTIASLLENTLQAIKLQTNIF